MTDSIPTVVVHFDEHGSCDYLRTDGVRLLVIDEGHQNDRVYEVTGTITAEEVAGLVGRSRIGVLGDMPGAEAAIRAAFAGEPSPRATLNVIEGDRS